MAAMQWEPAIYEHKAALIGKTPAAVCVSVELLVRALEREFALYRADYMTVGLDVYNVEVEALGARIGAAGENECPDVLECLYDLEHLPANLSLPDIPERGRFGLLLSAGKMAQQSIGSRTGLRIAASGPVTIAAKLVGIENLLICLCMQEPAASRLLQFANDLAAAWCSAIRTEGLEAVVFDSMAAPPMFSPEMYAEHILPLHQRLMRILADSGQTERELVIGGDTVPIAGILAGAGANMLVCDFASDAAAYREALGDDRSFKIRRNAAPQSIAPESFATAAPALCRDLACFSHPVAGTGILPYDFNPEYFQQFRNLVENGLS